MLRQQNLLIIITSNFSALHKFNQITCLNLLIFKIIQARSLLIILRFCITKNLPVHYQSLKSWLVGFSVRLQLRNGLLLTIRGSFQRIISLKGKNAVIDRNIIAQILHQSNFLTPFETLYKISIFFE